MRVSKEWLKFLREQYPTGSRILLKEMNDPHAPVPSGTMGTLERIDDMGTFHMKWDDGRTLGLIPGVDNFTVMQPEPKLMKLYMPLTADFHGQDEYGDMDTEGVFMDGRELLDYEGDILLELVKQRMPVEAERGIMHWYDKNDTVNDKVKSVVFTVEERKNQLWGVAECQVIGELSQSELEILKEYITGQASDGWGEGFEQQEIECADGGLYVHLWSWDKDWEIKTEEECFGQKMAQGGMKLG